MVLLSLFIIAWVIISNGIYTYAVNKKELLEGKSEENSDNWENEDIRPSSGKGSPPEFMMMVKLLQKIE